MNKKNLKKNHVWSYLWEQFKHPSKLEVITLLWVIVTTILSLIPPFFFKAIINTLTNTLLSKQEIISTCSKILWGLALLEIFRFILSKYHNKNLTKKRKESAEKLNQHNLHLLYQQSYDFFTKESLWGLVATLQWGISKLNQIQEDYLHQSIRIIVPLLWILFFISKESLLLGVILALLFVIYCILQYIYLKKLDPYRKTTNKRKREQQSLLSDMISNIITIKTFATQDQEEKRYLSKVQQTSAAQAENEKQYLPISITNEVLTFALVFLFRGWGLILWAQDSISVGTLVFFSSYLSRLSNIFNQTPNLLRNFFMALNDVEDLIKITQPSVLTNEKQTKNLNCDQGEIHIQNLSFSYEEKAVFKNLNLHVQPWEKIAIVWRSWSGKSTLTKLLYRFYELNDWVILVDNQDISECSKDSLRSSLSLVPQDPLLFHRSIRENIAYTNPNANDEAIESAAKIARCDQFISALPHGYDTLVWEKGIKLSWWERQRIAIARAILAQKKIFIMDEATSALDSESESAIQEAMQEVMKNKTCIIIAHRLSTIMQMDRIIVLDKGEIVEQGSHEELLAKKDWLYQNFWNIQSWGFLRLDQEN